MKSSVIAFLAALIVGVAATSGFFLAQPNPLAPKVKQLETEVEKARTEATQTKAEVEKVKAERVKLQDEVKATTAEVTAQKQRVTELAAAVETAKNKKPAAFSGKPGAPGASSPGSEAGSALRKMMETPGMRDMMRKQQEMQVEMTYGPLFKRLNLDDTEKENFRQILSNRASNQTEAGLKLMDANITEADRKKIVTDMDVQKKQSDADIQKFLNNGDDYKTFQSWEDTRAERMQLQMGESQFSDAPLSDEQREQLIKLMADARKQPGTSVPDLNEARNLNMANLTEEAITRQLQSHDATDGRVLQQAASFLSPPQVQALKKMQEQSRSMMEMSLKMTGQMFGGKK